MADVLSAIIEVAGVESGPLKQSIFPSFQQKVFLIWLSVYISGVELVGCSE